MIPNVADRGTSFVGVGQYLLHDKSLDGEPKSQTSGRVAWTETRNLMTEDPEFGMRLMAGTAMNAKAIKQAAGVSLAGRPSKGDVYHYSLAWHDDENGKISREDMMSAVDETLEELGMTDHQAVIIAHEDEQHPHVHVVVNLVNPTMGKHPEELSHDWSRLDDWAYRYRERRGEQYLYCPDRTAKREAIEKKKHGFEVDFVEAAKSVPRGVMDEVKGLKAVNDNAHQQAIEQLRDQSKKKDGQLYRIGKALPKRHKRQWAGLSQRYATQKAAISTKYHADKAQSRKDIYAEFKPLFQDLYRAQHQERVAFKARERTVFGKLVNSLKTIATQKEIGIGADREPISQIFSFISGTGWRSTWLDRKHQHEKNQLKRLQDEEIRKGVHRLNAIRKVAVAHARGQFQADRTALILKQDARHEQLKEAWKERNAERKAIVSRIKAAALAREKLDKNDKSRIQLQGEPIAKPVAKDFKKTTPIDPPKANRKRKPRTRKKKRD